MASCAISLLGFTHPSYSETNFTVSYKYFDVGGTSINQLWQNFRKYGPKSPEGLKGNVGLTTFKLKSPARFITKNGQCHIKWARFQMHSTINLPNWTDEAMSDKEMITYWKALSQDVKRHEEGHVYIAQNAISELSQTILALPPEKNCKTLSAKISKISAQNRKALNKAQQDYERVEMRNQTARIQELINNATN